MLHSTDCDHCFQTMSSLTYNKKTDANVQSKIITLVGLFQYFKWFQYVIIMFLSTLSSEHINAVSPGRD
jgi:hypothetical protein